MIDAVPPALSGWENFYVIVGSSGAALIGLQFVVIAVIKDTRMRATSGSISAFGTPTVVHFGGALLLSAIMSAPWGALLPVSVTLAIVGLIGLAYIANVIAHTQRQTGYKPVLEDWLFHVLFPCCAYAALAVAAIFLRASTHVALFVVGAATLGLLLIGIHNAWDTVTYVVTDGQNGEGASTRTDTE